MGHPNQTDQKNHSTKSDHQDPVADEMFGQYFKQIVLKFLSSLSIKPRHVLAKVINKLIHNNLQRCINRKIKKKHCFNVPVSAVTQCDSHSVKTAL